MDDGVRDDGVREDGVRNSLERPSRRAFIMPFMRFQLAPLIVACILSGQNQAQVPRNPMDPVSTTRACPVFPGSDIEEMRTQQIQVAEVTFLGSLQLPASEQQQIAS